METQRWMEAALVSNGRLDLCSTEFLCRLHQEFYAPLVQSTPAGLVAAAAAHHRLAWIHPFLDGNGRVTRLFTQAWLQRAEADADGLWTLARGLARRQSVYKAKLAGADERRLNDFDGRGYLSERRLQEFCEFALATAVDQLDSWSEIRSRRGPRLSLPSSS